MAETALESLPDRPIEEEELELLRANEDIRAAVPLANLQPIGSAATFTESSLVALYLHVDNRKRIVAFDHEAQSWNVIETVTDVILSTSVGQFDLSREEVHDAVRRGLDEHGGDEVTAVDTIHPGHPFVDN